MFHRFADHPILAQLIKTDRLNLRCWDYPGFQGNHGWKSLYCQHVGEMSPEKTPEGRQTGDRVMR